MTVRIAATFGSIKLLGDQPAVPSQDGVRKRDGGDQLKVPAAKPLADLRQCGALWIGKAQSRRKMRAEDAILGDEIFILEQQALVDEARYIEPVPQKDQCYNALAGDDPTTSWCRTRRSDFV